MKSAALEAKSLTKSFGDTLAVNELTLAINKGEILGLLGANGAGKSTTMQMMLGLIKPSSGSIEIFGQDLEKNRIPILKRMNFSSTYANLPSNLTVWQNLLVFTGLYHVKHPRQKMEEMMELFEISHLKKRVTGQLSSGESTRLNLCKAFLNDPELLLLDEPTASLDPDIADKVRTLINRLRHERNLSILYTSHNMRDIETICDRIIFLHKGGIIVEGTRDEIKQHFKEQSLEDVFIHIARDGELINTKAKPQS
ncbi:MAG: ABC transporter ATP-binding protein [Opitutaceae bacterium]|nr:ABC transporter ATP-binding protein [Opitutaceae bacterium]|tara:strand:- start:1536 stop:2297 length:762 start_codon:yes stop_codon:yes gene_type:complete